MKASAGLIGIITLHSLLFFFNLNINAQTKPQFQTDSAESIGNVYTLPAGTVIRARMDNGINSKSATAGDTFTTTVSAPLVIRSVEVIPAGAIIEGRVIESSPARRGGTNGFIVAEFEVIKFSDGAVRKIAGQLTLADLETGGANDAAVSGGSDGIVPHTKGGGSNASNVGFIAGGAGAGVVVGALTKGGGGAAVGGALGAGAGMLVSYFRKGQEAELRPGTEIGVVLKQSVTMPVRDY